MNLTESPTRPDRAAATQSKTLSHSDNREAGASQSNGAARPKCPVCGDRIGENCFCKLYRKEGPPVTLCCPSCVNQYIDSARVPADNREEELRAYEKSTHFFIGEDKPWS